MILQTYQIYNCTIQHRRSENVLETTRKLVLLKVLGELVLTATGILHLLSRSLGLDCKLTAALAVAWHGGSEVVLDTQQV